MIVTTWEKIAYGNHQPEFFTILVDEPTYIRDSSNNMIKIDSFSKKRLISTCFDFKDGIVYYTWEIQNEEK